MKTIKNLILIVLMLAIAVCGYLVYQEVTETKVPDEQTEQPQVTRLNDSTYHINLSDCSCITLEKVNDTTLNVNSVGVNFIHIQDDSATVRIGKLQTYVLDISEFYQDTQFSTININTPGD